MSTLHIEHPISDYTIWKAAFDRFAPVRLQSGVRSHRIQRPVGDAHYVVLDLDFDSTAEAADFCAASVETAVSSLEAASRRAASMGFFVFSTSPNRLAT